MYVSIKGFNPERQTEIEEAAGDQWNFEDWNSDTNTLTACGQSSLCGGDGEDEFSQRLTEAIWKANGAFCEVTVCATYMENLPFESYSFDEEDYQRFVDLGAEES
jgi:predicted DsbA family dithiol-disulfide isomerase